MKCFYIISFLFVFNATSFAQTLRDSTYIDKAEYLYHKVYDLYRVPKYGLFSEYFPNDYKKDLDYFQGEKVKTKEVSFLWPFSGVFSATNILASIPKSGRTYLPYIDSMAQAVEMYLDTTRQCLGYQAYPSQFEKVDRYYDDNGLVGIDYVDAYGLTKNKTYLARAKKVFNFILSGWDDALGGGVTWLEGHHDQKPACSNSQATVLSLKLYLATKNRFYLDWGEKFYNWMHNNLRDSTGVYWNDRKTATGEVNKIAYTYNTGAMLQSAVMLYKVTKNQCYLKEAQFLAEGSYNRLGRKMEDGRVSFYDLPWFVVVLFHGYEDLYYIDKNSKYIDAIIADADYAWLHARDKAGLIFNDWNGKNDEITKPKWLLDEACMVELYARIGLIKNKSKSTEKK